MTTSSSSVWVVRHKDSIMGVFATEGSAVAEAHRELDRRVGHVTGNAARFQDAGTFFWGRKVLSYVDHTGSGVTEVIVEKREVQL